MKTHFSEHGFFGISVKRIFSDSSAVSLLYANLITILLGFWFNWNFLEFIWIYLAQSAIIGLFNFVRMLSVSLSPNSGGVNQIFGFFISFFFLFHYFGFLFSYFVFLVIFSFGIGPLYSLNVDIFSFFPFLIIVSLIFFINHLISFIQNFDEINKIGPKNIVEFSTDFFKLMSRPYVRIIPMHLTIIFGVFIMTAGFTSQFILLLFLILKTFADLKMHLEEHKK